jgi:hypothetical protein
MTSGFPARLCYRYFSQLELQVTLPTKQGFEGINIAYRFVFVNRLAFMRIILGNCGLQVTFKPEVAR